MLRAQIQDGHTARAAAIETGMKTTGAAMNTAIAEAAELGLGEAELQAAVQDASQLMQAMKALKAA